MPNLPHIAETALLLLLAFLAGSLLGYGLRRLVSRPKKLAAVSVIPAERMAAAKGETAPALVTAPSIDPVKIPAPPITQPAPAPAPVVAAVVSAPPAAPLPPPVVEKPSIQADADFLAAVAATEPLAESMLVGVAPLSDAVALPKVVVPSELLVERASEPEPVKAEPAAPTPPAAPPAQAIVADTSASTLLDVLVDEKPEPPARMPSRQIPPVFDPTPVYIQSELDPVPAEPAAGPTPPPVPAPKREPLAPARHPGEVRSAAPDVERSMAPAEAPSVVSPVRPPPIESEDLESAAMRAIEGGSSSRRPNRPVAVAPIPPPEAAPEPNPAVEAMEDAPGLEESASPRSTYSFGKPEVLAAPRPEGRDNLRSIKGLDQAVESKLNDLGIYHFDQIADWDLKASIWLDTHLALRGRIGREKWIEQARDLSKGRPGLKSAPFRR